MITQPFRRGAEYGLIPKRPAVSFPLAIRGRICRPSSAGDCRHDALSDVNQALLITDREVEVGVAAEAEGEGLLRRAVPGEAGGIVAGDGDPDPVAGRDDGGDG